MRGGLVVLILAVALLAPAALAQGGTCRIETQSHGTITYPCGSGESSGSGDADGSFWDRLDIMLAIVGLVGSASAGGFAYYRVRTRRQTLTTTLAAIERAYADSKVDPASGIARLATLRADVRERHARGRIDDGHYLELDKRATQYIVKLRLLEVDRRFGMLPPLFLNEIRRHLADGVLTQTEADLIEARAGAYRIPEAPRAELADLVRRWASEDSGEAEQAVPLAS